MAAFSSLGQGVFFGLGGYCMAMFLKLEASSVENTKIQSTPGIPDFMDWNQITSLPLFWQPFHSLTFTIAAVILVPGLFALIIGAAMFKRRVGGTYFAIITQAVAAILTILIVGQQGYTGGINGMTDLRTLKGWDIRPDHAKVVLYFFEVGCLFVCIFIAYFIRHSKLGRILVAMREKEDRVRFSGYSVANFKIFAFCVAAIFSAVGGAMFALQVGFMSPSFVGIVPSIEMVIYTAVGGRLSILGAVYGTMLVNFAKTSLSESFPELWLFGIGRIVHRRGPCLPQRPGRHLAGLRPAADRPAVRIAQRQIGRRPGCRRRTGGNEEIDHARRSSRMPTQHWQNGKLGHARRSSRMPTPHWQNGKLGHARRSSAQGIPARGRRAHRVL